MTNLLSQIRIVNWLMFAGLLALILINSLWFSGLLTECPQLIIHADDAGMSKSVNLATIDAMTNGLVTSASILVQAPGFDEFADFAIQHPEMDFGVHLSLNCEVKTNRWGPVLPAEDVPSLVQLDGTLWPKAEQVARFAKLDEAEAELRAQIDLALNRGISLSHLDHHMMVLHTRPDLFRLLAKLGIEYGLAVRLPKRIDPAWRREIPSEVLAIHGEVCRQLTDKGLPLLDGLDAASYTIPPSSRLDYYIQAFQGLQPGVHEIVVHCAYDRPEFENVHHAAFRQADYDVMTSSELRELVNHANVQLIRWRDLL